MLRHIARRLFLAIPTLFAVFTIIFIIVRVAPGDPATAMLGDNASQQAVESLRERMGLNESLWQQYLSFLADLLRGDLGNSLKTGQPVWLQIRSALPHTLELTAAALIVGLAIGVPVGIVTAIRRNQWPDYVG
ncbi:MAG: ABC transporter permease, partial [Thermomicrobiales bacterium]